MTNGWSRYSPTGRDVKLLVVFSELFIGAGGGRENAGFGLPECWGIACVCPGPGALTPFACRLEGAVDLVDCCGRGFCLALGRTMGSACGLRFIGPSTPLGVCPGVRPGVRSAGEALMIAVLVRVEKALEPFVGRWW